MKKRRINTARAFYLKVARQKKEYRERKGITPKWRAPRASLAAHFVKLEKGEI